MIPELLEGIFGRHPIQSFAFLLTPIVTSADFEQSLFPLFKRVEVFRGMNLPAFNLGLVALRRFRAVLSFRATAVSRLSFHQILQQANHALDRFRAGAARVNKIDSKLS